MGKVISVDIFKKKDKVQMEDNEIIEVDLNNERKK